MGFRAIVEIEPDESIIKLKCEVRKTEEEACDDGEISKLIWGDKFISYQIVEV